MVLDGQRRRPHGHAGQARTATWHNQDEVDRRRRRPARRILGSSAQTSEPQKPMQIDRARGSSPSRLSTPCLTSDNVWDPSATLVANLYANPAAQNPRRVGLSATPAARCKEPAVTCKKPRALSQFRGRGLAFVWRRLHCCCCLK